MSEPGVPPTAPGRPMPHLHAVILAGGSGTRFWPLSRDLSPKQMLDIWGGESLIAQTVERALPLVGAGNVHLLAGERLDEELRTHMSARPAMRAARIDFLTEPIARNTAPAIALAAAYLERLDPDALVLVLPSDHIMESGERWEAVVETAVRAAEDGWLVTIGLEPDTPEAGYGYIKADGPLPAGDAAAPAGGAAPPAGVPMRVDRFVEKPDKATAERFLAEGGYLWNAGMLVARASAILAELEAAGAAGASPSSAESARVAATARAVAALPTEEWIGDEARQAFFGLPQVPFDTAVLEVSERVAVVPARLEWCDVGSLLSVERLGCRDAFGNVFVGRAYDQDSRDTTVYTQDRLVATLGLENLIVVDTADATLVAEKSRAQDVRMLVERLRREGAPEVVAPRTAVRPWGTWTVLLQQDGFKIKLIEVAEGERLSLQSHRHRSEHWVIVTGTARVTRGDEVIEVHPNESVYVPIGETHRLENVGKVPLKVIEVAVGEYLEEDDIVRFDDDWGRGK